MAGGWWLVAGGWWPVAGGRWLVAGGRWPVAGGWWLVASGRWLVAGGRWLVGGGWGAAIYNVTLRAYGDCNFRVTNLDCIPLRIDPFWSAGLESLNLTCQRGRVHDDRS